MASIEARELAAKLREGENVQIINDEVWLMHFFANGAVNNRVDPDKGLYNREGGLFPLPIVVFEALMIVLIDDHEWKTGMYPLKLETKPIITF